VNPLIKYKGLFKHESLILIQLRIGKIGLNSFLHHQRMPDMPSSLCNCGLIPKTPGYIAIDCLLTTEKRERLAVYFASRVMRNYRDFTATFENANKTRVIAKWFLKLNRLKKFRLTIEINKINKKRINKK
jgi:hypothetical protein